MSWPQRPGAAAPAQIQRHPQDYNNQQSMYPNYQGAPPPAGTPQQYWQAQQPQYNQQYNQVFQQQQDYGNNANQFYQQQTQYNQNYGGQGFANTQQQPHYQNYYQNQGVQPAGFQNQPNADSWEDNWDWGWDESSKQGQQGVQQLPATQAAAPLQQQQVFNNANVIEESFASTDTWNWSMDDKKDTSQSKHPKQGPPKSENIVSEKHPENVSVSEHPPRSASNASTHATPEDVKTLSDREAVKERLPNLALGKRFNLDNLTPQWSIESQMSQESSDGPQTHSEGTYRSDNQSRNSCKSSPGLNTENSNFNYSQSALDEYPPSSEWSRHSNEEATLIENAQSNSRRESHDELTNSLQEMNIANRENPAPEPSTKEAGNSPSPSVSPANLPPPSASFTPQPPASTMPPAPPVSSGPPPSSSSSISLPPTNFPQSSSSTNPFKQSGPFSHKKIPSASPSVPSFPPPSSTNLSSPSVVSKVSHHRMPVGFGANLETTPDNSERPDQPLLSPYRPLPVAQPVPDNLEVAPQNDRNEYLQTAHLSSGDYGENTDFSRSIPPPGLRRMVVGQQELEYSQNLNISGDEPPPGLARMVPGQQTEADVGYNQPGDNYRERHIDGQTDQTDGRGGRPYRQADGQQTPDFSQPSPSRGSDRRPIGLDRMVPGEPSNDEYPQYQAGNYPANEQRVVMGVDHDYPMPGEAGPTDVREQNVDGSDYSEPTPRSVPRNVIGAREVSTDVLPDYNQLPEDHQREVTMEGENLQDLSVISSAELTYSRDQTLDGADVNATDVATDRKTDLSDSVEHGPNNSRRHSLNRVNTSGEDSERDRAFKSSPRRDRDKHKSSRDRDRDRDRDNEGRYSRGDRKYDRDDRRSVRDKERADRDRDRDRDWDRGRRERDRDESPHSRRYRRSARSRRYDTEDTDYYSDRERDRRAYREGSYTSKPPRPDDKERRYDRERERARRYNTIERERPRRSERADRADRADERPHRADERPRRADRDRYEARYRDIDPTRKHGNLEEERRRVTFSTDANTRCGSPGDVYSAASRPESAGGGGGGGGAPATDEERDAPPAERRRERRSRHARPDPYYDMGGYGAGAYPAAYSLTRQQYEYYERLRATDPHAYLHVYKQLMAGRAPPPPPPPPHLAADARADRTKHTYMYGMGYEARDDRGSVHSGRSSTNGLKGNDTYYGAALRLDGSSLRDAPSLRTDLSDRELNTDASLNLHLEDSTVRSDRMTPFKFSTAHVKGSIGSRDIVIVRPSYPVDGLPATVHVLSLAAAAQHDPQAQELAAYPGPLFKGVTHKKSVMDYCAARVRAAARAAPRDVIGYVLVWELLALLLRQNGVVVGSDIAELLMKNAKEYEYKVSSVKTSTHNESPQSQRGSSLSERGREDERAWTPDRPPADPAVAAPETTPVEEAGATGGGGGAVDERAALDRFRELLLYGNRQEALEWAMSAGLWGHALSLSALMERRARAAAAARFLAALRVADPLHTLYAHLHTHTPPAATCVSDERWGDWRPHAAIVLANASSKPEHDRRTLTQLGDSLMSRGLIYSAQFCYVTGGVGISRHPLAPLAGPAAGTAPPRLALLLADSRAASLPQLATNHAIFATEIYEYALSLSQDYVIDELQVYKYVLATRLVDAGQYERALRYVEAAARGLAAAGAGAGGAGAALAARLGALGERLRAHEPPPPPDDAPDSAEPSPRHHWLDDLHALAHNLQTESPQSSPQHQFAAAPAPPAPPAQPAYHHTGWGDPSVYGAPPQYQQSYPEQGEEQPPEYGLVQGAEPAAYDPPPAPEPDHHTTHDDWAQHYDSYWQGDYSYEGAGAGGGAGAGAEGEADARPQISMPGAAKPQARPLLYADYDDEPAHNHEQQERDSPKSGQNKKQDKSKEEGKGGAAGGGGGGGGGGWLGGILTKLSLRAPNQMILPDDKNPTIVWDAENKRWVNRDAEHEPPPAALPPPPTALPAHSAHSAHTAHSAHPPPAPSPPLGGSVGVTPPAAGAPPLSNIFKMQKSRHIKKSYVDVFNPSGAATRALPPAAEVLGPAPAPAPQAAPHTYFVPAPPPHAAEQLVAVSIPCSSTDSDSSALTPVSKFHEAREYEEAPGEALGGI